MLKHICTTRCSKSCKYCLMKDIDIPENITVSELKRAYKLTRQYSSRIMLTGGEPTEASHIHLILTMAPSFFEEVHMTTANENVITGDYDPRRIQSYNLKSICFSVHNPKWIKEVGIDIPVYAYVMDFNYRDGLLKELFEKGYSGATIISDYHDRTHAAKDVLNRVCDEHMSIEDNGFTLERFDGDHCDNDMAILPDLRIVQCGDLFPNKESKIFHSAIDNSSQR